MSILTWRLVIVSFLWILINLTELDFRNNNNVVVEAVDLMFQLHAGREDCFFEYLERDKTMYFEYNVIETGRGDHDVNFQLTDPQGRPVVTEFRKPSSRHDIQIPDGGEYKICFDNTYSHFTSKQVAFTISTTNPDEADWQEIKEFYHPEDSYDMQVNEIKERMDKVRTALNEMESIQEQYRHTELRDRSIAEHNFERVNYWSTIFLVFSIVIGCIQVFMLKGLFDPQYNVGSYVKKLVR